MEEGKRKKEVGMCWLVSYGSGRKQLAGFCEYGNETSDPMK
jgi:hypothetical protein